jgi:predicted metal-dependent hydrolase
MPLTGLPEYRVRVSPRAKHVRLKVSAEEGVVVVIPKGFDRSRIPGLLAKRREWLDKHIGRIREHQKLRSAAKGNELPEVVILNAIGERWHLEYRQTGERYVGVHEQAGNRLLIKGNIKDSAACRHALRRWLLRKAHLHLAPWLRRLSEQCSLEFNRVIVKGQKTRWASCSSRKNISINYRLLFLPERLVGYVFRHELCHTRVMNHSHRFWDELRILEPGYKRLHGEARESWKHIPAWVDQR